MWRGGSRWTAKADFAGPDVAGKAVIIQTILAPGQMGNSASWEGATKRAEDCGAALIVGIWGYAGKHGHLAAPQLVPDDP
jgi:hypothetical protein